MEDTSQQPPTNTPLPFGKQPIKSVRFKKPLVVMLVIVAIAGVSFGAWAMFMKGDKKSTTSNTSTNTSQKGYISENQTGDTSPYAIVYYEHKDENSPYDVFIKPIAEKNQATKALSIDKGNYITGSTISGKYVALSEEGNNGTSIWLSTDSGKSYEKLWSGNGTSEGNFGDQITSLLFSRDQKRLLAAVYANDGTNTIKEFNTSDKQAKDLFTVDRAGVFFTDYDSSKLVLYYSKGCYNCDGNTGLPLYRRDILNNKDETVIATGDYLTAFAQKSDGSESLYIIGTQGDGLGAGAPYTLFRLESNKTEPSKILEEKTEYLSMAGYGKDDFGYYVIGSKLYRLSDKTALFDAETNIMRVGFASKDLLITESGEYPNLQIAAFDTASKKVTSLLSQNSNMTFIGVVEE